MPANKFEIESIFTGVDRLSRPVGKMGRNIDKFQQKATKNFGKIGSAFSGLVTGAKVGVAAIATVGVAAGVVLLDAAKTGAKFEQSLTNAVAKFPGHIKRGTVAFKELADAAKETGRTTEFTASASAEAINFLAAAGFNAKQSIAALPGVVDLATASQTDLAFATDVATDSLSAFGLMSKDTDQLTKNLTRVNDVFAKTVTTSNTTMATLFETVTEGGAVFKAAGFDIETFSTLAGALGSAGIKGSKAGTSLKNIALRLTNPVGKAAAVLDRLGVSTKTASGDMVDAIEVLDKLKKGFERFDLGKGQRLAIIEEVFGKIATPGVATLIDRGAESLRAYREEIKASEGASKDMATTMRDTVSGSFKAFESAVEGVKVELFDTNRNELKKFIDESTAWTRDNQPELVGALNEVVKVFRQLGAGIAFVTDGYNKFVTTFKQPLDFLKAGVEKGAIAPIEKLAEILGFRESDETIETKRKIQEKFNRRFAPVVEDVDFGDKFAPIVESVDIEPITVNGDSAIIGDGRGVTTREEKTTTNKIIIEAAPGLKARTEGEENPAIEMAPTGGL